MAKVIRFGVSIEEEIREQPETEVVGTLTLVYDHDHGDLTNRLVDLQHRYHHRIISTLHVHIDEHSCLEVLIVRGPNDEIHQISDFLIGTRGVQQGKLIISTADSSHQVHSDL
jgi:CopG family nickel-responsive transcriptional regulator